VLVNPANIGSEPDVGCPAEPAARQIDIRQNAASMEIIDCAVGADRHAESGADRLELSPLIPEGQNPNCRQRAIAQIRNISVGDRPFLNDEWRLFRNDREVGDELRLTQRQFARDPARTAVIVPSRGTEPAAAAARLYKEIATRQRVHCIVLPPPLSLHNAGKLADRRKLLFATPRVEELLVTEALEQLAVNLGLQSAIAAPFQFEAVKIVGGSLPLRIVVEIELEIPWRHDIVP
jgi:hypothetical protein